MSTSEKLRQAILEAADLKREAIELPDWPYPNGDGQPSCTYWVRVMRGDERDAFEGDCRKEVGDDFKANLANVRAKLVARTLVDENGERIFSDADVELLGGKSCDMLDRVAVFASRLNRLNKKDIKELAKN